MTQASSQAAAYAPIVRLLHWVGVPLTFIEFALGWSMPRLARDTVPTGVIGWHLSVGALFLALMLVRVVCRLIYEPDRAVGSTALGRLARVGHLTLYVTLLAVPVTGWANSSSRGWIVRLFGFLFFPLLTDRNSASGEALGIVHGWLAWVLLILSTAHIADVLFHRLVLRDGVLQRMM
ncbi:cytochrome b [Caballeronia concitans]|uniref:Cytochrome B561 n=1 Tax=Caballeronia concitans TaxID=1777133 RepID=A0A658R5F3_9BURK|nr:cytochrome b/b6 domain-containing protein [Caballeronia concitans]SAL52237.1 cytochrome B561 [Caballeronia concitans]